MLTKLRPEDNQPKSVHIELYAKKGVAIDCACWQTVSTCVYYNTVDEDEATEALQKLLFTRHNKKQITNDFNTLQRYRHFKKNQYGEANSFTMTIESECALTSESIFMKAIIICIEMLQHIQTKLANNTSTIVEPIGEVANFYLLTIEGHTHTIGNLLQSIIMNNYVRDKKVLEYIGYSVPHPLENSFILKIKFTNDTSLNGVKEFMIKAIQEIIDQMNGLMHEFQEIL